MDAMARRGGGILVVVACLVALLGPVAIKGQDPPGWTPPSWYTGSCRNDSRQYIEESLCDGIPDCADGTDESPQICSHSNIAGICFWKNPDEPLLPCPAYKGIKKYQCMTEAQKCDGVPNCPKATDESAALCRDYNCSATGRIRCPLYKGQKRFHCISLGAVCDGTSDCPGSKDEVPALCAAWNCSIGGKVSCPKGGQCLSATSFCDGRSDCKGGSDEEAYMCKSFDCTSINKVQCPGKGQCIDASAICDGKEDCKDKSDEHPSYCNRFSCASIGKIACPKANPKIKQRCIPSSKMCDGTRNCWGGTDEAVARCRSWQCPLGYIKCSGSILCQPGYMCDGINDCPYNASDPLSHSSDENPTFCAAYKCPKGWVKCKDGLQCIPATSVCDGLNIPNGCAWSLKTDCKDESDEDEKFCATYKCADTGRIPCPSKAGYCLPNSCYINPADGYTRCPDASDHDEQYFNLRGKSCPPPPSPEASSSARSLFC